MCICALDSRPEKVEKKDTKSSDVSSAGDRKGSSNSSSNKATSDGAKQSNNENGDVKSGTAAEKKDDSKKSGNDKEDRLVFLPKIQKKKKVPLQCSSRTQTNTLCSESLDLSQSAIENHIQSKVKLRLKSIEMCFERAIAQFQFYQTRNKRAVELCAEILTDFFSHPQRSEDIVNKIIF